MPNSADNKRLFSAARKVYLCTARNRSKSISTLAPHTALNDELGLDGDDVDDLFADVARFYPIEWSQFHFHQYFGDEGPRGTTILVALLFLPVWIVLGFVNVASRILKRDRPRVVQRLHQWLTADHKPFRLGAFVHSACDGKWTDETADLTAIADDLNRWQANFQTRLDHKRLNKKRAATTRNSR